MYVLRQIKDELEDYLRMKCNECEGTGQQIRPKNDKAFDEEFDRLDRMGSISPAECRKIALEKSGYTIEKCPKCNGTGAV